MAFSPSHPQRPVARMKPWIVWGGLGLFGALLLAVYLLTHMIHMPRWSTKAEETTQAKASLLPEVLTKAPATYQAPPAKPEPPLATQISGTGVPVSPGVNQAAVAAAASASSAPTTGLPGFLQPTPPIGPPIGGMPTQAPGGTQQPPLATQLPRSEAPGTAEKARPKVRRWLTKQATEPPPLEPEQAKQLAEAEKRLRDAMAGLEGPTRGLPGANPAAALIKNAVWAIPYRPERTLYRSMLLPGRLMDDINSDIPASTIRILLTVPVFDKLKGETLILDKGTIVIASQVGRPEYGQRRIPLKLEQAELPGGEILDLKATVGDEKGASGVPATVNNHLGQLLIATGINAVLQLGIGTAVGTPQGFQPSPAQQAAREAGQSVAEDINTVTKRQLKVPPTLERKAGAVVSVSLQENVQLYKKPYVAK